MAGRQAFRWIARSWIGGRPPACAGLRDLRVLASQRDVQCDSSPHWLLAGAFAVGALTLGWAVDLAPHARADASTLARSSQSVTPVPTHKAAAASAGTRSAQEQQQQQQQQQQDTAAVPLPVFSREEVAKHKTAEQGIWVIFKGGVYDITEFVHQHPGGAAKIMLAAGASVEPFWAMYQQHLKAEVQDLLRDYKIGSLEGGADNVAPAGARPDPWGNEPQRHPALIYRSERPCNAETPAHILAANLITNNDIFYVRNHLPVPELAPEQWRLEVRGQGLRALTLDLSSLRSEFKCHTVTATVQCAGNRRNEMKAVKAVKGLDWDTGAIGTAVWSGVKLRDVLLRAGLDPDDPNVAHIHFLGADTDPSSGEHYATSIPLHVAMDPLREALLAYEMNGQPLSRDHGAPLRLVVPGTVGARCVKWLSGIVASDQESGSHWQQHDYKSFSPSTDWDSVDWTSAPAIQDPPVTSAITEPLPGTALQAGTKSVPVRGYAWSGGGRAIVRVDVTADGGASWTTAELKKLGQRPGRAWAWTLWEAEVQLPPGHQGPLELACKAVDESYNSQPDSVAGVWNLRGVVNNAWHRVSLQVQ
ncbi:Oxidoreductase, molybdopterin-binding domain-containing protein [Haematococcus lacustris]